MKRRHFLGLWSLMLAWPAKVAFAALKPTPAQAEGPFYPVTDIPLRQDLILQEQGLTGQPIELSGRVLDASGKPMPGIKVEIWQCDGAGIYDHPGQSNRERFDPHFAGFGAQVSDEQGGYKFRTLYPVPYGSRPPHIHVKLWRDNRELLTTQLYLDGQTGNEWWGGGERKHLQFNPVEQDGRLAGRFDFVLSA